MPTTIESRKGDNVKLKKLLISVLAIGTCFGSISVMSPVTTVQAASTKKAKLNKKNVYLKPKKTYTLKVLNNKKKVTWTSSNKKVAKVSSKGVVTALKNGTAKVKARIGNAVYNAEVDVSGISLDASANVFLNKTKTLHLNGTMDQPTWSSADTNIADIDENGVVTGINKGTTTITATYQGTNFTSTVTVLPVPKLSKKKYTIGDGQTYTLKVKNNTANLPVTWTSSNKKIATVSKKGVITAKKKAGKATITATINGLKLKCALTVKKKIRINQEKQTLVPTETLTYTMRNLKAVKTKGSKKAKKPTVTWSVSNKKVATITKKGKVTAKKAGTVTIKAKVNKKTYTTKLYVKKPIIGVAATPYRVGLTYTLGLTNVTKTATWSSSNKKIAKITSKGVLTPVKNGTATITAKVKNYKVKAKLSVVNKYTVKFNANGAPITTSKPADITAYADDSITLATGGFYKPGYNLSSWNTKADGSGTSYSLGGTYSGLAQSGTITLYAQYTLKDYATTNAGEEYKALDLASISSSTGAYTSSKSELASVYDLNVTENMYVSIDDFINYQIAYAQYDGDTFVIKSGWKSTGQILKSGYKYRLLVRKVTKADIAESEIPSISNLLRYETSANNAAQITANERTTTYYIAHRGYHDSKIPDNSITAFEKAAESSHVQGIETDVYNTADNKLVINHNKNYNTAIKNLDSSDPLYNKEISEINYSDLANRQLKDGSKVPTLQDYIDIIKAHSDKRAIIEIKKFTDPSCYQELINEIVNAGIQNRTTLISFNIGYLENIKNTIPAAKDIAIMGLYSSTITDDDIELMAHFSYSGINQSKSALKDTTSANNQIYAALSKGLSYGVWTIKNNDDDISLTQNLIKLGVNYVTLDGGDTTAIRAASDSTSTGSSATSQNGGLADDTKSDQTETEDANTVEDDE